MIIIIIIITRGRRERRMTCTVYKIARILWLNEPKVFQAFKLSPTFLYFGAYLGRFPTFFNMFGQYTDNLARKMGTPITHTTHIRWLHIRKKQSTHIYIWTLPRCPYLILTPFSSLHMCIQNIHAFFYKKLVYKKLGSKIYVKLQ